MSVADTRTPVTVVTGASNGIGRAIAEAVLAQGRAVVNLDYVLPTWSHPLLTSYQGDLTDEASTRERAAEIAAQHNVTALVNNAGATRAQGMAQGDGATVGVDARGVVGQAEVAQHGQALGGKGLVEFDHVHLRQR